MIGPVIDLLSTIILREYYHVKQTGEGKAHGGGEDGLMLAFFRNVHQKLLQQWEAFILERSSRFKGHSQAQPSMQRQAASYQK